MSAAVSPTPKEAAEFVRLALREAAKMEEGPNIGGALAALDSLLVDLRDARREASEWEARAAQRWREVQAACARAEQAFRERDQARDALQEAQQERDEWAKRAAANPTSWSDLCSELYERLARLETKLRDVHAQIDARWKEEIAKADGGDEDGDHIGIGRHHRAIADGLLEAERIARAALGGAAEETG